MLVCLLFRVYYKQTRVIEDELSTHIYSCHITSSTYKNHCKLECDKSLHREGGRLKCVHFVDSSHFSNQKLCRFERTTHRNSAKKGIVMKCVHFVDSSHFSNQKLCRFQRTTHRNSAKKGIVMIQHSSPASLHSLSTASEIASHVFPSAPFLCSTA